MIGKIFVLTLFSFKNSKHEEKIPGESIVFLPLYLFFFLLWYLSCQSYMHLHK